MYWTLTLREYRLPDYQNQYTVAKGQVTTSIPIDNVGEEIEVEALSPIVLKPW